MSKYVTLRGKKLPYSFLASKRTLWVILILLLIDVALAIVSTGVGSMFIEPMHVVQSIFGNGPETEQTVVVTIRLPRIIIAILAGAAMAVAGAMLQGLVRNPLASPDMIGITNGASLGAVLYFFFLSESASIAWLPVSSVIGALGVAVFIYVLSWKSGVSPLRLVLIGVGISASLNAVTYMLLISGPTILAQKSLTFMSGSIYGVSWEQDVWTLLPWIALLMPVALVYARHINIQELGDEIATGVGSRVQRQRLILLFLSVSMAGASVAVAGAISFIGLMAPHIARKLVGPAFGGVLPVAGLLGIMLLLIADMLGRTVISPAEIPAGVFTAAIGAPFFIYLLYRSRNR